MENNDTVKSSKKNEYSDFLWYLRKPFPELIGASAGFLIALLESPDNPSILFISSGIGAICALLFKIEFIKARVKRDLDESAETLDAINGNIHQIVESMTSMERLASASKHHHFLIPKLRDYHELWVRISSNLGRDPQQEAWIQLANVYLEKEIEAIHGGQIETTSHVYTKFLEDYTRAASERLISLSNHANRSRRLKRKLFRFQISGMLPEEFYNGSQVEYSFTEATPLFVSHMWEDYKDFYSEDTPDNCRKMRCLLVRDSLSSRDQNPWLFNALPTLQQLELQATLGFRNVVTPFHKLSMEDQYLPVAQRILARNRQLHSADKARIQDTIKGIIGSDEFHFYPITDDKALIDDLQLKPLLTDFIETWHSPDPLDATYAVINPPMIRYLSDEFGLFDARVSNRHQTGNDGSSSENLRHTVDRSGGALEGLFWSGRVPELALFGEGEGDSKSSIDWKFGILGQWQPFSKSMTLRFLTRDQAATMANAFWKINTHAASLPGIIVKPLSTIQVTLPKK